MVMGFQLLVWLWPGVLGVVVTDQPLPPPGCCIAKLLREGHLCLPGARSREAWALGRWVMR